MAHVPGCAGICIRATQAAVFDWPICGAALPVTIAQAAAAQQ
jgi:hypothetical protein